MINFIDVSEKNCWIGQLSPGGSTINSDDFKNECINEGYYRIGWTFDNSEKYKNKSIKEIYLYKKKEEDREKNIDLYFSKDWEKQYNNKEKDKENSLDKALDSMNQMKVGDIIVTRVKGNYYMGEIKETAKFLSQTINNKTSYMWSVKIKGEVKDNKDTWIKVPETEMPGDIVGRFSQRRHPTIQRVGEGSLRFKLLLIKIFQKLQKKENSNDINIEEIILNKNNFTSALNYMNLEDLVYLYIKSKNDDYQLLPSTCKVSKQKYEMDLINPERELITCQVKNNAPIEYNEYESEEEDFKKIYLFSGREDYKNEEIKKRLEEDKDKEDISIPIGKENEEKEIIIIRKENLFKFFKDNDEHTQILKKWIKLEDYYKFVENTENLPTPNGWKKCEKNFSSKNEKEYKINEFSDIIFKNNCIKFSSEFNSLIQYGKCDNEHFINELKEAYGIK